LYDINGNEVSKDEIRNQNEINVNGSTLISGIYILVMVTKAGTPIARKLAKK